jgi:hypothetical protein
MAAEGDESAVISTLYLTTGQAMYACASEPGADFSRVCAGQKIGHAILATHPHRTAICEWFYASTVSDHSHRSKSLFTALALVLWQQAAEQRNTP